MKVSRFFSTKYSALTPYTPGEQPRDMQYIKLNTNESPFPPSQKAQQLAAQAAESLQLYSDPTCAKLREIIAADLGVAADEIVMTNGSDEILNFVFMAFCDSETPAAFPDITYGFYPVFANLNNIEYEEIPLMDDFTVRVSDYIGINKTILIANPNAPTGIALPLEDIEKIVASNPYNVVVIDEAYVDFGTKSAVSLIGKYENLLVTRTFSKSRSMAGARLGFGVGNRALIQDIETLRYSTNPYNVNAMTMAAGIGAMMDKDYFLENCRKTAECRQWTTEKLRELGFKVIDSVTNFVFAKSPDISGKELYLKLREKGVLVRHFDTERLREYNRITIGSSEQMEKFINVVREILEEKK